MKTLTYVAHPCELKDGGQFTVETFRLTCMVVMLLTLDNFFVQRQNVF